MKNKLCIWIKLWWFVKEMISKIRNGLQYIKIYIEFKFFCYELKKNDIFWKKYSKIKYCEYK